MNGPYGKFAKKWRDLTGAIPMTDENRVLLARLLSDSMSWARACSPEEWPFITVHRETMERVREAVNEAVVQYFGGISRMSDSEIPHALRAVLADLDRLLTGAP